MIGTVKTTCDQTELRNETQHDIDIFQAVTPVLLAGGVGRRLWPLSRPSKPKPFLSVFGRPSLFRQTIQRIEKFSDCIVCGHINHHQFLTAQLGDSKAQIFLEPHQKGTAPAVALAAHYLKQVNPETVMCVMPTDHYIEDLPALWAVMQEAALNVQGGKIVSLVMAVQKSSKRFGYFVRDKEGEINFIEKPDAKQRKSLSEVGELYCNTGIFLAKPESLLNILQEHDSQTFEQTQKAIQYAGRMKNTILVNENHYEPIALCSVDEAVIAKAPNKKIYQFNGAWKDRGHWTTFFCP